MSHKNLCFAAATTLVAGAVFAHHIPVPLSYAGGLEILDEVVVLVGATETGLPAYRVGTAETPHHVHLTDGASFSVTATGVTETVTFSAADFADIANASDHEVVDAINAQLTTAVAMAENGHFAIRGVTGGPSAELMLTDGAGSPLETLHLPTEMATGSDTIRLELSVPTGHDGEDDHGHELDHQEFPHHPYLLLASTTPGSFLLDGHEVPIGRDATMSAFLKAAQLGLVGGFQGELNETSDAHAKLPLQTLADILGQDLRPSSYGGSLGGELPAGELYLAYVVFDLEHEHVAFVSNVFTVRIQSQP